MPLFYLGFRPFFLAAGLFAVIVMIGWGVTYSELVRLPLALPAMFWHGHEMIYGYGLAVIAGFLLTSVRNWTGLQTLRGLSLAALAGLWLIARVAFWSGYLLLAMGADLAFSLALLSSLCIPLIRARQTTQVGLMSLLLLLLITNQLFYLLIIDLRPAWVPSHISLHQPLMTGLYTLMAFILVMIGRLLPAFTRMATAGKVELPDITRTSVAMTLLMTLFIFMAPRWVIFPQTTGLVEIIALLLALLHGYRLWRWRHREIATRSLLWVIYAAYLFIVVGFVAFSAQLFGLPGMVATHAFAVGGAGLATLGLMARVALGHTGRDVYHPPKTVTTMIGLLLAGTIVRVFAPLLAMHLYATAMVIAQFFWVSAFGLFLLVYTPILVTARPDGKPG